MTLILGLDPGTATTGYGLVNEDSGGGLQAIEYGTIQTPAGIPDSERLVIIYQRMRDHPSPSPAGECSGEVIFSKKCTHCDHS